MTGKGVNLTDARCVWAAQALLGEGPVWWPERDCLLFVDIKRPAIHTWRSDGVTSTIPMPAEVGSVVLRQSGGLVAALRSGIAFVDFDTLDVSIFATPEHDLPGNRFNDGKCDPRGRYWLASMDDSVTRPTGAIWRLDSDLRATRMGQGFIVGNGFGWSPDGRTMYFTDSENRVILAHAIDSDSGTLGAAQVFARVAADAGYPDGLCVDAQGYVWSAHWDGWRITRYAPDGGVDRVIPMPVPRPTSVAFGRAGLDRLYVTSSRMNLDAETLGRAPLSGGLFELDVGVCGRPEPRFAG